MSIVYPRREILAFLGTIGAAVLGCRNSRAAAESELQVEWRVAEEQVKPVTEAMAVTKGETYEQRNPLLIGVVVLVGVALVPKVAQAIVDVYYRYKSGGVIIDARSQPVVISTSPRVAPGYALIISSDGVKTVQIGGAQPITGEDFKGLIDILTAAAKKG